MEPTLKDDLKLKPGCQADYRRNYHTFVGDVDPEPYWRYYYQLHKNVDEEMMKVMNALLASRYKDDTIVVLTSDHGDMLGAHGYLHQKFFQAYDETTRVPLIIWNKNLFPRPRAIEALTSHADLAPTLLGLAGIDPEPLRQQLASNHTDARPFVGRDLSPSILGQAGPASVNVPGLLIMTDDNPTRGQHQDLPLGRTKPGYTSLLVPAGPNTDRPLDVTITAGIGALVSQTLALKPVKPRTLHLLPHSHVDIGYSDPQPEVERKQWKNLRDAVALGLKTASYPPEERFKWNVEGLWSVESYLKQASPEEREAFLGAVRNATIVLQANDTNILTGLATPEELRRWTSGSRRLRAAYDLGPMPTAMHSDIPGLSWTSVAALAEAGPALPCRAIWYPSMQVTTEAASPGILSRFLAGGRTPSQPGGRSGVADAQRFPDPG